LTYLITSPYGPLCYRRWLCEDCASGGGGRWASRESVRASASAHVTVTGHEVTVFDGTLESLYAVATDLPVLAIAPGGGD
jgi:hypothetical protein